MTQHGGAKGKYLIGRLAPVGLFRLERLSPGFLAFLANSRRKFEKVPAPAWIFLKHGCQSEDDE